MEYKIGDRVRIVSSRVDQARWNPSGEMDRFLGTVMTVDGTRRTSDGRTTYRMREDHGLWNWYQWMIECKEEKAMFGKSDLVTGDILFARNGNRYVVMKDYGESRADVFLNLSRSSWSDPDDYNEDLTCGISRNFDVLRVIRPIHRRSNCIGALDESGYKIVFQRDESRKKLTVEEIERLLGYKVAIVDEEGK